MSKRKSQFADFELCHVEDFTCAPGWQRTPLNSTHWEHMVGDGTAYNLPAGWGNNEPQIYTDSLENAAVVPDPEAINGSALEIVLLRSASGQYTSARLRARPGSPLGMIRPRAMSVGSPPRGVRIAARVALPRGADAGVWPAVWLLPNLNMYGTWAASGEIDIMEAKSRQRSTLSTVHFGGAWPSQQHLGAEAPLEEPGYHVYALEWHHGSMSFYRDEVLVFEIDSSQWHTKGVDKSSNAAAPFDQEFHLLLNLAAGGDFCGLPPEGSEFPQRMRVDYISLHYAKDGPSQN